MSARKLGWTGIASEARRRREGERVKVLLAVMISVLLGGLITALVIMGIIVLLGRDSAI